MDLYAGQVLLLPLDFTPSDTLACNGQLASTNAWPALFEAITTIYGGNGTSNFGIPNIAPQPVSGGPALNWVIVAAGSPYQNGGEALVGEVRPFPAPPQPNSTLGTSWSRCDGRTLSIAGYEALYSLIGTTFGGNGTTTFGLPDIASIPASNGPPLDYYIAQDGIYPSMSCDAITPKYSSQQSYDGLMPSIAQVAYPSPNPNNLCGLALCQGQLVPLVEEWYALFSLLSTRFGGNGSTNFALPNMPAVKGITNALLYNGIYPSRN